MAFDPAPAHLDHVVSPAWLTDALRVRYPGRTVTDVTVVELLATQATKVRLRATLDGDDVLPLCIKGVLTDTGAVPAASLIETRFYRDLARDLPVRVPACLHAGFDAAETRGVIVMEDVIARGATFGSAMAPVTADEAGHLLEQLAALHAATWRGSAMFESAGIPSFLDQIASRPLMPRETLQALLDGPRGEGLADDVRRAGRLEAAVLALRREIIPAPTCLVHGDAHAGNIYRDAAGVGIVDWQIFQAGSWAQDVAYSIATVLTPEDRARDERMLLARYLDHLASAGGPAIAAEEAWRAYRAAMVYGYYLWAITRKVEPEIIAVLVGRLGRAVAELDSLALLGA